MTAKPAKRQTTGKRGGKTSTSWKPGQSGNPAGRAREGESWATLFKTLGNLTGKQAAEMCQQAAGRLKVYGDKVTLKEAVVLSTYASLIFDPNPGLLNAAMDRAEGKVAQKLEIDDWRAEATAAGLNPDVLVEDLFRKVAEKADADDAAD